MRAGTSVRDRAAHGPLEPRARRARAPPCVSTSLRVPPRPSMGRIHGPPLTGTWHARSARRPQVKRMGSRTLNPNARFMRVWDLIVILALVGTALITPFEVRLGAHPRA